MWNSLWIERGMEDSLRVGRWRFSRYFGGFGLGFRLSVVMEQIFEFRMSFLFLREAVQVIWSGRYLQYRVFVESLFGFVLNWFQERGWKGILGFIVCFVVFSWLVFWWYVLVESGWSNKYRLGKIVFWFRFVVSCWVIFGKVFFF